MRKIGQTNFHFAAFDFRQIENVVDHIQQHAPRFLNVLHVAALLVVQRLDRIEHFRKTDDAIERRAQLVAHGRQKIALQAIHFVQPHVRLRQFIHLLVQLGVGMLQLVLRAHQMPHHFVERHGHIFEFVGRVNFGPRFHVAARNFLARIAQMLQRFDDHIPHNYIAGDHRQKNGDDRCGQKDGAVVCSVPFASPCRE